MAVTSTPVFPQAVVNAQAVLLNSTGAYTFAPGSSTTNLVSVVAGGTNGTIIEAINITTSDTTANVIWFILNNGTADSILTVASVAAGTGVGTGTSTPFDLFHSVNSPGLCYDVNGNRALYIPNGTTLYAGTTAAVTSGKQVSIQALGGNL
jgi:hypothetical protein